MQPDTQPINVTVTKQPEKRDVFHRRYVWTDGTMTVHKVAELAEFKNPHGVSLFEAVTRCGKNSGTQAGNCKVDSGYSSVPRRMWCRTCAPNGR